MNIAVFTDSCLPYCSGVTYAVLAQVGELCRRGHRVAIFRPKPHRRYLDQRMDLPANARMYDVPCTLPAPRLPELRLVLPTIVTSLRRLRRIQPDVIHVNTEWGCGWEGLWSGRLLKIPVVGTFHTFFAEPGYLKSLGLPNWRAIQSTMWRYSVGFFNRCSAVTSPSHAVRQTLLDHGINSDPLVISNGISDPPNIAADEIQRLRQSHGIDGPAFIYVGRVAPEKSLDVLVSAFSEVCRKLPDAKLVVVGDGPSRQAMDGQIRDLGIDSNVVRLGFIPHRQLIEGNLLRLGDAFVTASKTENQPISVLEAMTSGLPVIGPRAHGLCEMIDHGSNGLSFFPDDAKGFANAMIEIADPQAPRYEMGNQAKRYAQHHSLEASVDQLESLYLRLARQPMQAEVQNNRDTVSAA